MIYPKIFILFLLIIGCSGTDQHDALRTYLIHDVGFSEGNLPSAIFVITEDGCSMCEKAFADLVRPRISCPQCLFLIRAEGRIINMEGLLSETENIRFDYDRSFKKLGLLDGSGVVLLRKDKIDTVIPLRVHEIKPQLAYMAHLLDSISGSSATVTRARDDGTK